MRSTLFFVLLLCSTTYAEDAISFRKEIAPLLVKNCQSCHGAKQAKSKYRLDTFEHLMKPGASDEPIVTAGKLEASELYRLLITEDKDERMPKKADALPADQIALVKKWIEQGAKYDGGDVKLSLSEILPRVVYPAAPEFYSRTLPVTAVTFTPDGAAIIVSGYHELIVRSATDGALIRRIGNLPQRIYGLAISGDGQTLAVAGGTPGESGEVRLISLSDGQVKHVLHSAADVVFDVKYSPDGKQIATAGADGVIRLFDVQSNELTLTISNHSDWVSAIAFSDDSKKLASASRDKTAKAFDLTNQGQMIAGYLDHNNQVQAVAFHPDGDKVYSAGVDRRIMLWNLSDSKRVGEMGLGGEIYELVRIGDELLACSGDNTARLFDAKDRKQLKQFSGHTDPVYAIALHPATRRAASGSHDGQVRIWNLEDAKELAKFVAVPMKK
mgnify:CR=1 FL=1